jgi:tRNA1(Val) A37 N6-methylase TrmN6
VSQNISENEYLGGRVRIRQPVNGYRAGVDPVLLAASIPARSGQSVLELGLGVGTAALCLSARVADLSLTGVEIQADYAALARENGAQNGADLTVIDADITALPPHIKAARFDHVIANPPYFDREAGREAQDVGREMAMGEATPLGDWLDVAARRVAPKGYVSFIHRAERLHDLLRLLPKTLGSIQVQPLQPRVGRDAHLVILRARHSGKAPLRMHAPILMHDGAEHGCDAEDYTAQIKAVLRDGAALGMVD